MSGIVSDRSTHTTLHSSPQRPKIRTHHVSDDAGSSSLKSKIYSKIKNTALGCFKANPNVPLIKEELPSFLKDNTIYNKNNGNINYSSKELKELPKDFGDLKLVKKSKNIDFFNNQLEALPESFGNLKSLEILSIAHNKLETLPESFSELKSLKKLCLNNNQLETLPDSFGNLTSLMKLIINCNKFQELPASFGNLESLKILNIAYNQLKTLPASFGELSSLKTLYFNNNPVETLPDSFSKLSSLETLHINNNQLKTLPTSFKELKSLTYLYMKNIPTLNTQEGQESLNNIPPTVRHLEVSGTLTWEQIPEHIQNNHNIFIDISPQHLRAQNIHYAQNTHTQSVGFFSSLCATKLQGKFHDIDVNQALTELKNYIKALPKKNSAIKDGFPNQSFINKTAHRCINTIPHKSTKDELSNIDIKTFLALFWKATQDDNVRATGVSKEDALKALVQGLYEIKRGYNIGANYKDDGKNDSTICHGGTFNKIYEKVCGVLKDTDFKFITQETIEMQIFQNFNDIKKQEVEKMGLYRHITDRLQETIKERPDIVDEDGYLKGDNQQILEKVIHIFAELLPQSGTFQIDTQEELKDIPDNLKEKFGNAIEKLNENIKRWMPSSNPNSKSIQEIIGYLKLYCFAETKSQTEIGQSSGTKHDEIEEIQPSH